MLLGGNGITVFHVCAYRGHLECVIIIYQYMHHFSKRTLMDGLKASMKKYGFKSSDVKHGIMVSLDRNLKSVVIYIFKLLVGPIKIPPILG